MVPSLYPLPITLFGEWHYHEGVHLFCHTVQVVHINITSTRLPGPKVSIFNVVADECKCGKENERS